MCWQTFHQLQIAVLKLNRGLCNQKGSRNSIRYGKHGSYTLILKLKCHRTKEHCWYYIHFLFIHLFVIDIEQRVSKYKCLCTYMQWLWKLYVKDKERSTVSPTPSSLSKMDTVNEVCLVQHKFSDTDRDPFNGNKFVWLYQVT